MSDEERIADLLKQRDQLLDVVEELWEAMERWYRDNETSFKKYGEPQCWWDWSDAALHTDWKNVDFALECANIGLDPAWVNTRDTCKNKYGQVDFKRWWEQQWEMKRQWAKKESESS